jgi:hypothetical protein
MSDKKNKSIPEVEASKEIYAIARREADTEITKLKEDIKAGRDDGFAIGAIKTNKAHRDYCDFLDALVLYRAHKDKNYKKTGLSWEKFCEATGYERTKAERIIKDIEPVFEIFSGNMPVFSGVSLSDIRWLGKNKTGTFAGFDEDGNLVIDGKKIPATTEDIIAYINNEQEIHKQEKEETTATLRTKERLLKDKETTINKMEKEIMRLEKRADKTDLTEEEQDACNLLYQVQVDIMSWFSDIKKKIQPHKAPEIALRQYYYLLIFFSKLAMEERLILHEEYKEAEDVPWEISEMELPPTDVMIDNLPMTAGKGLGKKVVAKMEERNAPKSKK